MASSPTATTSIDSSNRISVHDLQDRTTFPTVWYRLHVLLFDLQNFDRRPDSQNRLDKITDPSYIGAPYFTPEEATRIKDMEVNEKTFEQSIGEIVSERLDQRVKKRVGSGDFRVCAAHDLAPIIADTLNIDLKQIERDKVFMQLFDTKGLDLQKEQWCGLVKKSFALKRSKKRRVRPKDGLWTILRHLAQMSCIIPGVYWLLWYCWF